VAFLYDGVIVADPERIITADHSNMTARTVGSAAEANNCAGGATPEVRGACIRADDFSH
jgi:hypothetical protein